MNIEQKRKRVAAMAKLCADAGTVQYEYLNEDCDLGGFIPFSVNCQLLAHWLFSTYGEIEVPDLIDAQREFGVKLESVNDLVLADLIFIPTHRIHGHVGVVSSLSFTGDPQHIGIVHACWQEQCVIEEGYGTFMNRAVNRSLRPPVQFRRFLE